MQMMRGFGEASQLAAYATPEVRALFEDWVQEVEETVLDFVNEQETADPQTIAAHLGLSVESATFFISRLAQKGELTIGAVTAKGA